VEALADAVRQVADRENRGPQLDRRSARREGLDSQKLAVCSLTARLAITGIVKPAAVGLRWPAAMNNPDNSNRNIGLPGWIPVPGYATSAPERGSEEGDCGQRAWQ
jgi:hypothetical protein